MDPEGKPRTRGSVSNFLNDPRSHAGRTYQFSTPAAVVLGGSRARAVGLSAPFGVSSHT
jgi:hypothetical protein